MLAPGTEIAHYRIRSQLGAGGMGEVYLAEDIKLGRLVALKVLPAAVAGDPQRKERFLREARAASALSHPNVAHIYEVGDAGVLFLAMEYVEGQTVTERLKSGPLAPDEAAEIALRVADALDEAHTKGIVHRDIKPSNLMLTLRGEVKILDFGLAKLTATIAPSDETLTAANTTPGLILGTLQYMSPEQALGRTVDGRSDLFALGATLFEALTGRAAFQGASAAETLEKVTHEQPPGIARFNYNVPPELERIVRKCLEKDRERRYQSAREMVVDLKNFKRDSSGGAHPPPPAPSGQRVWMLSAAGVVAIALAAGAWWKLRTPAAAPASHAPRYILKRLTSDSGLSGWPALSPDGKLLAYASDRAGEGNLDIWVRQVAGGDPVRVTKDEADDLEPSFSPDGSKIAFRSRRKGGGIYVVSSLGGEERLIAPLGRDPRFSPEGSLIAYWVGEPYQSVSKIFAVSANGGTPRPFHASVTGARYPLWSPDGTRILFSSFSARGWLVAAADGSGSPVPTTEERMQAVFTAWSGQFVYYSGRSGDSANLYRVAMEPGTWKLRLPAERLTSGATQEGQPSVAGERIAFTATVQNADLWSLPMDTNAGRISERTEPQRLTEDQRDDTFPMISSDGALLTYSAGASEIRLRNLSTGREEPVIQPEGRADDVKLSADGTRLGFAVPGPAGMEIWTALRGETPQKRLELPGRGWSRRWRQSRTGRYIMAIRQDRDLTGALALLDLQSGEKVEAAGTPGFHAAQTEFSPDERWLTFLQYGEPGKDQIVIVPLRDRKLDMQAAIPISEQGVGADLPRWSPNGNWLYYLSRRDGSLCVWAQRLDLATKKPVGPPLAIRHFHNLRRSIGNVRDIGAVGLAVAADKIVVTQTELTSNIWLATPE